MKRIISFILTFCILMSLTTSFAENDSTVETNENIIDTNLFTDENVLYKAMQERNGSSLFGLDDSNDEGITTNFDVVMGFDMSYSMYEYDINGDKQWMDSFKSISEQAPEDTRYAVLSSNTGGFTDDLDMAISDVQEKEYTGTNDIISILDRTISMFDDESNNRNKVVLVTTHKVDDVSALKDKIDELSDYGIIPFVFILNTETNNALNMDGIYQCSADLELRMAISDLYLAFIEFNMTYVAQTYANTIEDRVLSDFRTDRHMFVGADSNAGLQMASMLNMYKCVPLKASIGTQNKSEYDLFNASSYSGEDIDLEGKLRSFVSGENAKFGEVPYDFQNVWNNIFGQIANNRKIIISNPNISQAATVLRKNMKRRFPMMIKHDDEWEIVYEYRNPIGGSQFRYNENKEIEFNKIQAVFDTYEYLMSTVSKAANLYEKVTRTSSEIIVEIQYPSNYDFTIDNEQNDLNTIRREALDGKSGYINFNSVDKKLYVTAQCTGENTERNFVVGSLVTFTSGFADVYGANKVYYTRYYRDITINDWFHDCVFKATNLGIVSGTDENKFEPNNAITLAQLFRMMFESAKVDGILTSEDNPTTYWAYPYMKKASELGFKTIDDQDIDISINQLDKLISIGETKVSRGEAAKYICQLFFDKRKEVNVPILLYDKVEDIDNERKNAYEDFMDVSGNKNGNYIYKLYMNNILNGQDKNTMAPDADVRRSEICTMLIKCLFDMDENIPVIIANIEENTELVPVDVHMTTDERIIKNISFNNNNKVAFNIHIEDDEEYEVEIEGGTETTIQGGMDCIVGTGTFTPETSQTGNFVYTIHGPGVFQLNLVRSGIDSINLKITKISAQSQVIPLNQVITQDMINRKTLSFTAEKNGYYIINVTPGTTFNLTDQTGRKVEDYYTELYRGFDSYVPQFITQKMMGVDRKLNYIDSNGNTTSRNEVCDCYKYYLEKGMIITIDTIRSNVTYKLQVDTPQEGDIVFKQHTNEDNYFIFSDNPEAIKNEHLAENNFALARFEDLEPGTYTFMSWHKNDSDKNDLMVDVQLYANPGTTITFEKIGINGVSQPGFETDWSSPRAYANFIGWDNILNETEGIVINNQYDNIHIEKTTTQGEQTIWLSDVYNSIADNDKYVYAYPKLNKNQYIFIIFEFSINNNATLNHVAYTDPQQVNIGTGASPFDASGAFKGISNAHYEIESDFDYTIDGNEFLANDGKRYIPVTLFNLNNPLGYSANYWETNVNPQQDPNTVYIQYAGEEKVRDIATETNLLMFQYKDINKKYRYGDAIPDEQREEIWYFDQFHKGLDGIPETGVPMQYCPNQLSQAIDYESQIGMANYSVLQTYNVHFKNDTDQNKTVKFYLHSPSKVLVRNENLENSSVELKEKYYRQVRFGTDKDGREISWYDSQEEWMATMEIPANGEANYKLSVVLVTADVGSIRNYFRVE